MGDKAELGSSEILFSQTQGRGKIGDVVSVVRNATGTQTVILTDTKIKKSGTYAIRYKVYDYHIDIIT